MIYLNQSTGNTYDSKIEQLCKKQTNVKVDVDSSIIDIDINKLTLMKNNAVDKVNIRNLKVLIRTLEKLKRFISKDKFSYSWSVNSEGYLYCYPMQLGSIREYGIRMNDYLRVGDKKLVILRMDTLKDLIALEMGIRELGYSVEQIDSALSEFGILSMIKDTDLISQFGTETVYKILELGVESSPFVNYEDKNVSTYCGNTTYNLEGIKTYNKIVYSSCRYIMSCIAALLISKISKHDNVALVSCSDCELSFTVGKDTNIDKILEPIAIRVLGRKVEVTVDVEIY